MSDTHYLPAAQKMIVILYRAVTDYRRNSVQNVVRFLFKKVPLSDFAASGSFEWHCAAVWWKYLDADERQRLVIQYKFAAKIR